MTIIRFFSSPAISNYKSEETLEKLKKVKEDVVELSTELCYHVELEEGAEYLNLNQIKILSWILSSPLRPHSLKNESIFKRRNSNQVLVEIGPRFNFSTPDSSNSVQICQSVGLTSIVRLEASKRYLITLVKSGVETKELIEELAAPIHDRMTQCIYTKDNIPRNSFNDNLKKNVEDWFVVPLQEQGKQAMIDVNSKLGLAFDAWDLDFYTDLFLNKIKRNPTSVELFDLAQSNSEHSRHWFFKGKIVLDGEEWRESLIDLIASTQQNSNNNNVIKFGDNSSAIRGFTHMKLTPKRVDGPSQMVWEPVDSDIIFTAETHNMPTAVAPFSGATTGTGGRIRDVQSVGRGGHTVAGTAGYCVGNLHIPGYDLPWEEKSWSYPSNFAKPLEIIIEASNGASDYGNKFGEPLICGFVQSYGLVNASGTREEFVKPIMFSGGIGYMPHDMIKKNAPENGMLVVKIGGPVYRIGVGGGAASSVPVQGDANRDQELDFGAVQRGDAEMGNRLNRAVRGCLEAGINPIESIHDQGAGGNGNVLKEIVEPKGALIFTKEFQLGDPTLTTLELWGAEYQENNALLCGADKKELLQGICERERCPVSFVGEVTQDGFVSLIEDSMQNKSKYESLESRNHMKLPFHVHIDSVLGDVPRKQFDLKSSLRVGSDLSLTGITVEQALERVLRLVSVASKRYLTTKVDRCVTGLIAQQQCVGPLHAPLADCAVIGLSYKECVGSATSIGTHNLKGTISPEAGARMSMGEALTNLVFAAITDLRDVKCSGNWMWPGKSGAEGGSLARAARALAIAMKSVGIAIDGGKDSLSMTAQSAQGVVKSPGTLVISTYAPCPDVRVKIDPALVGDNTKLVWVPITPNKYRLGGTALAQTLKQSGRVPADADNLQLLVVAFNVTQALIKDGTLLSGHDISDGGIITTLIEMAIGGLRGIDVNINVDSSVSPIEALFNEELGLVVEVHISNLEKVLQAYNKFGVPAQEIGSTGAYGMDAKVTVSVNGKTEVSKSVLDVYRSWEETSYRLDRLQANPIQVDQEWNGLAKRKGQTYKMTFDPKDVAPKTKTVKVAVLREEGTNGDREMIAALMHANFEVYDVTMSDLHSSKVTLEQFQGLVFPGGFSYADTLGSAKGWAAGILFSEHLSNQFRRFRERKDTFALGVCNGCQLMAMLGWIDPDFNADTTQPQVFLDHNLSERFECRWSTVQVNEKSSKTWLKDMGGSALGVWVAHGEGRFTTYDNSTFEKVVKNEQIAFQYVDDDLKPTEEYPYNPNGSSLGTAGVASKCGRFLALMPHPERCFISWQSPYKSHAPWLKLFSNAYAWASEVEV